MTPRFFKFVLITAILFIAAPSALATSGACSGHEGVNCAAGPDSDGSVICNDGTLSSSVMYRDMRDECGTDFVPFKDIDESNQNYESIITLYEDNVINGYPDNTYKPETQVNRAEFLKILIEGSGTSPDPEIYKNCFPDVGEDWFAKYVCYAKENNWIEGYPDGQFKPANQIALVEALKMLIEIHGYQDELAPAQDSDYWYVPYGDLALQKGFIDNTGSPYDPLEYQTRAQIAEMTYRSMQFKAGETAQNIDKLMDIVSDPDSKIYLGRLDAPVVLYAYNDYQCPFCKIMHDESFDELKTNYIDVGDVLYIPVDMPLSFHSNSKLAAHAARCANDQGLYWEMNDKLYETQSVWGGDEDPTSRFEGYAVELGADDAEFKSCMDSKIHMAEIEADYDKAIADGVLGTPAFMANGEMFVGSQPYEDLKNYLDEILYGI